MKALLIPFALVFLVISRVRNFLYDRRWLRIYSVPAKVISIGNITAGGTGKTPLTALLAEHLARRGFKLGLVSRGYRGSYQGIQKVPPQGADPRVFGDEPAWLASELPATVSVYVGRSKVEAAQTLCRDEAPQVIITDDGFQHRRLHRDLDIVVIDATEALENYWPLPVGRARESLASLKRAGLVIFNKSNFVPDSWREKMLSILRTSCSPETPIVEMKYELRSLTALHKEGEWPVSILNELRVLLVSGLGRPETFEGLVKASAETTVGHLTFGDHHAYSKADCVKIEQRAKELKADALVITQKDAVKLKSHKFTLPVFITQLGFKEDGLMAFYAEIDRKII